ncbi:Abi family protein [Alkalibacterium psychrotolerans]
MKPHKSLDEQIDLLKNRNLSFDDEELAKRYLLTNNYYDVINGYSKLFMDENKYIEGTLFDEISHIHFFDREVKFAFFKHIIVAENHFKSILSYNFSEKFKNIPYAYLKTNSYKENDLLRVTTLISKLSRIISNKSKEKNANPVKHYANNHNDVPIWVIVNYMTFGEITFLFKYLDDNLKNKIAYDLNTFLRDNTQSNTFLSAEDVDSFLSNINEIRNVSAHNNRLLGHKCRTNTRYIPVIHKPYKIAKKDQRQDVFNTFLCLQAFLSKNQYAQLHNTILKRFKHLDNKLTTICANDVLETLGFPLDWHVETEKINQL